MEIETIKKQERETTLEIENQGKRSIVIDSSITNTRDGRENLRCRKFLRENLNNNQRKCKMQKDPESKHPGNPGHNEKTKSTYNSSR
jgi:hypothetical protein